MNYEAPKVTELGSIESLTLQGGKGGGPGGKGGSPGGKGGKGGFNPGPIRGSL